MRHKRKTTRCLLFLLVLFLGAGVGKRVRAASAVIKISALSEDIQVGDTFSVSIQLTSTALIGEVSQVVAYDTNVLKFMTETSIYEEENGRITIRDEEASESNQKYILQFRAIAEGTASIKISGTPIIYSTEGNALSFSNNALSVLVGPKREKSTNRNLKSLRIKEGQLENKFQSKKTEYRMQVAKEVTSLTITATPEDAKAKVAIIGADHLLVGENVVTIQVTSETNKKKEYSIVVTRGVKETESIESSSDEREELLSEREASDAESKKTEDMAKEEKTVHLKEGTLSISGEQHYELTSLENLRLLPKGYLSKSLVIDGQAVDAYQLEGKEGQGIYLVCVKHGEGAAVFYLYDSREQTMQRYVENTQPQAEELGVVSVSQYKEMLRRLKGILIAGSGVVLVLLATAVHYYRKSKER